MRPLSWHPVLLIKDLGSWEIEDVSEQRGAQGLLTGAKWAEGD